jgi:AcrR family transcriptional regulator
MTTGETTTVEARPLPRGPHRLTRETVIESQRGRMIDAIAVAVADKGYGATTVGDVVSGAGVSRKTFYEQFANKQECFLAAYDAGVESILAAIDEAIAGAGPDPVAIATAGTRRYLETLAASPAFARTFLVEVLAAGPEALARRTRAHERCATQLAQIHRAACGQDPDCPELPPHTFRACVGAIHELVTDHVIHRGAGTLPDLLEPILAIERALLLAPPATRA